MVRTPASDENFQILSHRLPCFEATVTIATYNLSL
jgi:hypothetical protein